MSLLTLLIARAYAPLGARGALVDGLACRRPAGSGDAARPPSVACAAFPVQPRRHARGSHSNDERDSLAA